MITETGGIRAGSLAPSVTEPARQYRAGERVAGRYRLEEREDEGPLGEVWRAVRLDHDGALDVRLKILRCPADSGAPAWFEARAFDAAERASHLHHPCAERVLDYGSTDRGDPFLACEYLDGETLETLVDRDGPLDDRTAAKLVLPVIEALTAAHELGVEHGDIHASRVLLVEAPHARPSPRLVDLGVIVPDGASGGIAFDIYALCRMTARLVEGAPTADGSDAFARILARGLDQDPYARWQSARDLGKALAIWLLGHDVEEDCTGALLTAQWFWRPSGTEYPSPVESADEVAAVSERPPSWAAPVSTPPGSFPPAPIVDSDGFVRRAPPLAFYGLDAPVEIPRNRAAGWAAIVGTVVLLVGGGAFLAWVVTRMPDSRDLVHADQVTPPAPAYEEQLMMDSSSPPAAEAPAGAAAPVETATLPEPAAAPQDDPKPAPRQAVAKSATPPSSPAPRPSEAHPLVLQPAEPPAARAERSTDLSLPTSELEDEPATPGSALEPIIPFHEPKVTPKAKPKPAASSAPVAPPAPPPPPPAPYAPDEL